MEKTWASGSIELLNHAKEHMSQDSAFDKRIAFISIDNAVELMIKTYLNLPKRFFGDSFPSRKEIDSCNNSFTLYLDLLAKYIDVNLIGINESDIEHYHRIRNTLYHDGTGLSVGNEYLTAYFSIAELLLNRLFNCNLNKNKLKTNSSKLGEIIQNWNKIEEYLIEIADVRSFSNKGLNLSNLISKNIELNPLFEDIQLLFKHRNEVVHSKTIDTEKLNKTYSESERILFELKKYTEMNKDKDIIKSRNFFYEPSVSTIRGILTEVDCFGPPNYGETPDVDLSLKNLVLVLNSTINVHQNNESLEEGNYNFTRYNVDRVQLLVKNHDELKIKYLDKKLELTGKLFGAHTGYHITPILMEVEMVKEID